MKYQYHERCGVLYRNVTASSPAEPGVTVSTYGWYHTLSGKSGTAQVVILGGTDGLMKLMQYWNNSFSNKRAWIYFPV